jgi:ribose-phosphate pyrophosphokinase
MARLLSQSGADDLITVELHSPAISSFFALPQRQLHTAGLFADHIKRQAAGEQFVVVSPDQGGIGRATQLNSALDTGLEIVVLEKRRPRPDQCLIQGPEHAVDLTGLRAILVDDIVSTGGTLVQAGQWLADQGADSVWACVTHLVAASDLPRRLTDSPIDALIVTDSLPCPQSLNESKVHVISLAPLLATTILCTEQKDCLDKPPKHQKPGPRLASIRKRTARGFGRRTRHKPARQIR